MDQKKIGMFLKELRKEKNLTQEQLSEHFGVSDRSVSRWETGTNMPDLSLLVEIADFYDVDVREILDGERKSEKMNQEEKDTLLKVADYAENERDKILKKLRLMDIIGIISLIIALFLLFTSDTNDISVFRSVLTGCLFGSGLGCIIGNLMYVTGISAKISRNPKRKRISKIIGCCCFALVAVLLILSALNILK